MAAVVIALSACAPSPVRDEDTTAPARTVAASAPAPASAPPDPVPVDPRDGGLEVGLAEWAVTLEAAAIRPGPVTFVVHNGGTRAHGFEIEVEGRDSSGPGSGDGFKAEGALLQPGGSGELTFDLAPGVYKIECLVDGHDDLGMEILLDVRADAPFVTPPPATPDTVAISGIKFRPAELSVPAGTEVTWTNEDPAPHTVTAEDGSFDSEVLEPGDAFAWTFETGASVTYFCAIHPDMRGTVTVE